MRLFVGAFTFVLFISILTIGGGMTSCTKDHTIYDTVRVTEIDTLVIRDTVLTESILTSHPWKLAEVRGVIGGAVILYQRGGSANSQNFDNAYYTFNADKTGAVVDNAGASHTMTSWALSSSGASLVYTMFNTGTITSDYTWDNIRYKDGSLHYDDYFHDNYINVNNHSQEIQIQK